MGIPRHCNAMLVIAKPMNTNFRRMMKTHFFLRRNIFEGTVKSEITRHLYCVNKKHGLVVNGIQNIFKKL